MTVFFAPFRPWITAVILMGLIEGSIYFLAPSDPFARNNFLQYSFATPEPAQRLIVFHKLKAFADSNPTIVQSGDSSGFYGIEPAVVMKHLPPGVSYLNMSCCANLGYRGYYNIFEFMAQRSPALRYMVLHITPYTMPRPEMWDADGANLWGAPGLEVFGRAIRSEFVEPSPIHLPSLGYRRQVTSAIYYAAPITSRLAKTQPPKETDPVDFLRVVGNSQFYLDFLATFQKSKGWMPEADTAGGVYASECDIPTPTFYDLRTMSRKTYLLDVLESFAALAKHYRATLVIVFQPVACVFGTGKPSAESRSIIEGFKRDHPEVEIPFPLIETWPVELFSVPAHIRKEHTDLIGNRLGEAMAAIVARRGLN